MFRAESLPVFIKRILLFFAVLLAAVLQNTDGLLPDVFGVKLFLLIPLVVSVGMYEGEISGLVYGMIAGCFWDVCSMSPDGFNGLFLAVTGCTAGLLVRFFMRNKLLTQYCVCGFFSVLHGVLYWLFTVYIPVGDSGYTKLLGFYLPGAVMTTVFSFASYYFVRLISRSFAEKSEY